MKAGFVCMGQVNCFVRKGTGTILSPLPPLNLGKCLAEGEVTVKIASFIKIDIWFVLRTSPLEVPMVFSGLRQDWDKNF